MHCDHFLPFVATVKSLSHPSLGWLYVFSSFPPPPQQLLPLTSKPFQLNLRYLAQRIYGSGEIYWMTFPWPWPKVMARASENIFRLQCKRGSSKWASPHHKQFATFLCNFYIFSCDQAALWMVFSVRLSVCPSVCPSVTPFWLCSHHRIIMKFSGVITRDQGKVHAKGQGQRSKVKVTEVTTQLNRFRTVTPVWIHIWWWNYTYSLMLLRRGALLFLKVIRQISRSLRAKNRRIWPRLGVSGL